MLEEGAKAAEAYMRAADMDDLPADFWTQIIEARRFGQEKSEEEQEEHIADDAMSFLLQFYGYPASRLDPAVLRRTVDIFYAPEMTAWQPVCPARVKPSRPCTTCRVQVSPPHQLQLRPRLPAHRRLPRLSPLPRHCPSQRQRRIP